MRVLLLHPEDGPGTLLQGSWDLVIDLGIAGAGTYDGWSKSFRCPVEPLPKLGLEDFKQVRQTLFSGLGRMVDGHGFDWWELISIGYHERVERILALEKLAERIGINDEVFVSRDGFDGQVMQLLLGRAVRHLRSANPVLGKVGRKIGAASRLRFAQMVQILGDKYDADYRIRRWTSRDQRASERPVVLLPTAYVNVSRTGLAYAAALPDRNFLMVATRQSGWVAASPKNVKAARLASYAPGKRSNDEYEYLLVSWRKLYTEFHERQELSVLSRLGALECVPSMLRDALGVRDAWLQVFEREPVTAVLCADDSNTYTRLPLLIAQERGVPAIACHHGALDGRHFIKQNHADVILAKGRMDKDYLVNVCGVADNKVEIGAPIRNTRKAQGDIKKKDAVVFFSELYELAGGRCGEFYGEVLPHLAEIAVATNRELVVKLHPAESLRERKRLVRAVLSPRGKSARVVEGPLGEELLARTWFAVTVLSTTAVDCSLRGIPVFLCTWLDYLNYRYVTQLVKFGAGTGLSCAREIAQIPKIMESVSPANPRDLWDPITPERLDQMLSAREHKEMAVAV